MAGMDHEILLAENELS